ncbi:MAG: exodeoxyribonuclease III [Flavobacterium sp.]
MKIISYNVNGIRAAITKGLLDWLKTANPDVLCLQEIKATVDQIPTERFEELGYHYQYYFSAQKKGYSGVAILCKKEPNHIEIGTKIPEIDFEGRNIRIDYDNVSIMSIYLPSGTNIDRLDFKFGYMDKFLEYIKELKKEIYNLVICGDYNICHQAIDIHDPVRNANVSGYLPQEREWLGTFLNVGFTDSFRLLNPITPQYSWWTYRANARNNNKGWRIDYCMVSNEIKNQISRAYILSEAKHSDHCPVVVELLD